MSEREDMALDAALRSMTRWEGESGSAAEAALEATARPRRRIGTWRLAGIAACLMVAGMLAVIMSPTLQSAKRFGTLGVESPDAAMSHTESASAPRAAGMAGDVPSSAVRERRYESPPAMMIPQQSRELMTVAPAIASVSREVVRRAEMTLRVGDVGGAVERVSGLARPEFGEYVAETSQSGSDEARRGRVVLRVTSARFEEALRELRALGSVESEQSRAEDVTGALVDLDARIRNEERVEREMLELIGALEKKSIADVLEGQRTLGDIRERIEQYRARQAHLSSLASLSTITVLLEPELSADKPEKSGGTWSEEMGGAWRRGLRALGESVNRLVEHVVGLALLWGVLGVVVWLIVRAARKAARREATLIAAAPLRDRGVA